MDIITLDFETYYAKDFTLSKMTTEEYIRDDRFEVIGVSVKVNDGPTDWYSGDGVHAFLNSLDYSDKAILCHNTAFDGAILSWVYGIKPKFWFDTLSMARPLHKSTVGGSLKKLALFYKLGAKGTEVIAALGKRRKDFTPSELKAYADYCINDTEITYALFKKLKVGFPVSELMVIDQTIRMYTEPLLELDRFKLKKHLAEVLEKKQKLLATMGGGEEARKTLMSNPKFAALLGKLGAIVPMKISPTTGKETFAFAKTDQGFKDLFKHSNPAVRAIVEARAGVKSTIEETRTQRLIDVSMRGPLPIMLHYYGAHTGRFSGGDKLNLQNLPARKGNAIRSAICAPEGQTLIACDSSQIEARMLAYLAGQHDLVKAFDEGRDIYSEFATDVFGYKVDRKQEAVDDDGKTYYPHKTEGFVGKTCILGLGYGMGHVKFRDTLAQGGVFIDEHEAKRIVYMYRNKYAMIKKLWDHCDGVLAQMVGGQSGVLGNVLGYDQNGITLPSGLVLKYNALRSTEEGFSYISDARAYTKYVARIVAGTPPESVPWTNIYGGKVVENVVQALARIVITDQMTAVGQHYHVAFQVHDEIIISVDDSEADTAMATMIRIMSAPPKWAPTLPVACEAAMGKNYGDCK